MSRLWEKGEKLDEMVLRFTAGSDPTLDRRLVPYDVEASIAHARMLHEQQYLSSEDFHSISQALREIAAEHAHGVWQIQLQDEDVHTALENRLTEKIGEAGARIHLGRSRNDQVLAALRLYLKDTVRQLQEMGWQLIAGLRGIEERQGSVQLPGIPICNGPCLPPWRSGPTATAPS